MKKITRWIIFITIIFLVGCNGTKNVNISENSRLSYSDFVKHIRTFRENFISENYISASTDELIKEIIVFPDGIQLDNRLTDAFEGDTSKPSKYVFYYLDRNKTVFIKLNFIYAQCKSTGIILQSIVSPTDNIGLKENYHTINRPCTINKILSLEDYLVHFQYYLIDPGQHEGNRSEKINKLIDVDKDFYREFEKYILANDGSGAKNK